MEIITNVTQFNNNVGEIEFNNLDSSSSEEYSIEALGTFLSDELKRAKRTHLDRGEVLLPTDLTMALARQVHDLAEDEPYGLKGCNIYIDFVERSETNNSANKRRLCAINCDPSTTSTFEVEITLKSVSNTWNNFLPQFLKKMTRGTVIISSEYELKKRKLYRSYDD